MVCNYSAALPETTMLPGGDETMKLA